MSCASCGNPESPAVYKKLPLCNTCFRLAKNINGRGVEKKDYPKLAGILVLLYNTQDLEVNPF